ncbi:helix-turn-helix transcriptional regulator [Spirosoma sp. BT702]|uniref:Helix-turn-helix transcriptional regulator n=1 Tax=Spirosoma profusum TaxID=2771354 RepID=A0A927AW99_9BACT|nr:helix-turn-helix transcriptional regulator [Spirosoma profusum]MBD2705529.1 helix-turn-helix transcriptional regulator [Spirosoma profusum]
MSEKLQKAVGETVRAARKEAGLTQSELGELAGMKQPNIAALEKGKGNLSLDQLEKIAVALGKDVKVLLQ